MAWSDYVALRLEVASIGGHGASRSKWAAGSDPFKSRWTPAPTDATGEPGRWESTVIIRDQNWTNWNQIPWVNVICEAMTVTTAAGWTPLDWNASPNGASFTLVDPEMDFSPAGTDLRNLGIGFDLPIRLVADWLDPAGGEVTVWAGLIREIVWSATPAGLRVATIRATEVTEVYGRTEPAAEGAVSRPAERLDTRLVNLHQVSDMPNLFLTPQPYNQLGPAQGTGGDEWTPDTAYASLVDWGNWTDANTAAAALDHNVWSDMCHWINAGAGVTVALNYSHSPTNSTLSAGTPRLTFVPPFPVKYPYRPRLEISDSCSSPDGYPFASPVWATPPHIRVSPQALQITSSQASIANDVKIALAGTTGNQAHKVNQASVDAYGRHTYGRNDLRVTATGAGTASSVAGRIAWRIALRTSEARDSIETLEFPVATKRDLQALVGWHYYDNGALSTVVTQPGRVAELHWADPVMDTTALLITRVEHSITPTAWSTRLGCEMFDMDHYYGKDNA